MNWLIRTASNKARLARNVERLEELRKSVHELAYFGISSQSAGHSISMDVERSRRCHIPTAGLGHAELNPEKGSDP